MDIFVGVGGVWVVGMVFYVWKSCKTGGRRRCNVKREIIRFKVVNNEINDVTKRKF